jgi:hypothetical protein
LAPRQNRVVIAGLIALGRRPEAQYDTLLDIVFAALTRAHPALTREEFDDWPIAAWELLDALPVIAKQTGFLRSAPMRAEGHIELPDWDALIAQFVNFLPGTTPDYWEDALTAPRLEAMREEWRRHPPLPVLAAAWLGYKPRPRDGEALEELMRLFPGGQLRVN